MTNCCLRWVPDPHQPQGMREPTATAACLCGTSAPAEEQQEAWSRPGEQSRPPEPCPQRCCPFLPLSANPRGHNAAGRWEAMRKGAGRGCRRPRGEARPGGQALVARSGSWKQAEQQDLLTLHTQRVKTPEQKRSHMETVL